MDLVDENSGNISHKVLIPEPIYPQVLMDSVNSPFMNFCISNLLVNEDFTYHVTNKNDKIQEDSSMNLKISKEENANTSSDSKFIAYYPNFREKFQIYKRCREISDNFINIYFAPINSPIIQPSINDATFHQMKDSPFAQIKENNNREKVKCNCTKNNCLKQYCECLKAGKICDGCNCRDCKNTEIFQEERNTILEKICLRKSKSTNDFVLDTKKTTYCNCKKSSCQKKYCECYLKGEQCNEQCKCRNCQNINLKRKKTDIEMSFPSNLEMINSDNSLIIHSNMN